MFDFATTVSLADGLAISAVSGAVVTILAFWYLQYEDLMHEQEAK